VASNRPNTALPAWPPAQYRVSYQQRRRFAEGPQVSRSHQLSDPVRFDDLTNLPARLATNAWSKTIHFEEF